MEQRNPTGLPWPQPDGAAKPDGAAGPPADDASPEQETRDPESPTGLPADLDARDIKTIVEGILFATAEPLTSSRIAQIIPGADGTNVRRIIRELHDEYDAQKHAFQIEEIAGGFQIFTRPDYYPWVKELTKTRREVRLSQAAVETLAIIAYKQPIIRADVEDVRGVAVGPILRNLMEMNLVRVVGRSDLLGRPMLYGTTRFFLQHFGLGSLKGLPKIRELLPPAPGDEQE